MKLFSTNVDQMDLVSEIRANESNLIAHGGFERLSRLGISATAYLRCGSIGIAKVQLSENQSFSPSDAGQWMIVHPIPSILPFRTSTDIEKQARDLIAYDPNVPERWYRRTGREKVLGWHSLLHSALEVVPLQFHDTPFRWLKNGGTGVVVLDELPFELSNFSIGCESYCGSRLGADLARLGL